MEFNVFEYFKDYKRITKGPMTAEEQGTSLFLAGNMGERIREFADVYAAKNRLSCPARGRTRTLLRGLGEDYVMWGTDSCLWGNPQLADRGFPEVPDP